MQCLFCLQEKKLIKAHIIPEWAIRYLYFDPKNRNGELLLVNKNQAIRRPVGTYDKIILCEECDNKIGLYDNYAKEIFMDKKIIDHTSLKLAYLIEGVDGIKIKLFFISVLWRASISKSKDFSEVQLNIYENSFREAILNKKPINEIEIILGKYDSQVIPLLTDKNIQLPHKARIGGLNFYVVYMPGGFKVWVKIDKRCLKGTLSKLIISNNKNNIIVMRLGNYEESNDFKTMCEVAKNVPEPSE